MSERFLKLGVPAAYLPHARHFDRVFRERGMTNAQVDAAIRAAVDYRGSPDEVVSHFGGLLEDAGVDPEVVNLSLAWRDQVNERGIENMPQSETPVATAADFTRLEELRADMAQHKSDSKYWKDPALRDEYRELLDRVGGDKAPPAAVPADVSARKEEIRQAMRADPVAYSKSNLPNEYAALLRAEGGETAPPDQSVTTPSNPAGNAGLHNDWNNSDAGT